MDLVAPNLAALIGEIIGARLISHAGAASQGRSQFFWICFTLPSLQGASPTWQNIPASTVQILGAEKALFRAIKTKARPRKS